MSSPITARRDTNIPPPITYISLPDIPEILALSSNGNFLAIGFWDKRCVVVINRANQSYTLPIKNPADSLAVANDGTVIISYLDNSYMICHNQAENGDLFTPNTFSTESWVRGVALSQSGRLAAAGMENGRFALRACLQGSYQLVVDQKIEGSITAIALTPSGKRLALGTASGNIRLFNVEDKTFQSCFDMEREVVSLTLSSDGCRLFARNIGNQTSLWEESDKEVVLEEAEVAFAKFDHYALICEKEAMLIGEKPISLFHPDAKKICLSSNGATTVTLSDRTVKIWTERGEQIATAKVHKPNDSFTQVALSSNGRRMVLAGDWSGELAIFDL